MNEERLWREWNNSARCGAPTITCEPRKPSHNTQVRKRWKTSGSLAIKYVGHEGEKLGRVASSFFFQLEINTKQ